MDDYTRQVLERAEKRSKALGLASSVPLSSLEGKNKENKASDSNVKRFAAQQSPKKATYSPKKTSSSSPRRVSQNNTPIKRSSVSDKLDIPAGFTRTVTNNVDKNDADVAVEVNITSNQNIQVEVEVAEYEMDSEGNMIKKSETTTYEDPNSAPAQLRDTSRKNLKRLEALYAENEQKASPIQRTEETFCAEEKRNESRPIKKFSKLAALAQDINSWEDDYGRHDAPPTIRGAIPKTNANKLGTPEKSRTFSSPQKNFSPTAHLKWDRKVIDSLEAQGFTRRESTVPKLVYDYADSSKPSSSKTATFVPASSKVAASPKKSNQFPSSPGKSNFNLNNHVKTTPVKSFSPAKSNNIPPPPPQQNLNSPQKSIIKPTETKSVVQTKRIEPKIATPTKSVTFSSGLQKSQKDPAEMSLKERMAIFEKNKGAAPIPKCRFGLAEITSNAEPIEGPSKTALGDLSQKINNFQQHSQAEKKKELEDTGLNVKGTVSKLLQKEMTISEKQISDAIRKQKEQDMQCVLNRFNPQPEEPQQQPQEKEAVQKSTTPRKSYHEAIVEVEEEIEDTEMRPTHKRRSSEQVRHSSDKRYSDVCRKSDDKKRVRVSRLYPVLSDIESTTTTTDSDMENYTTATVSGTESANGEEGVYQIYSESSTRVCTTNDEDQNDSYEEYSEEDDNNLSFGREILKSVQKNDENRAKIQFESTASSEDISDVMDEMDQYLDEALENDISSNTDKADECSDSFEYSNKFANRMVHRVSGKRKSTNTASIDQSDSMPVTSKLEINPSESPDGKVTLVHTVSFYRRQQSQSANNTPIRKVMRNNLDSSEAGPSNSAGTSSEARKMKEMADEKIKKLLNEVCKQQTVIAQTSQALNLCASTIEFSGSTEAVEGERHLLVATHRRQACLNEIQRLKVEGVVDRVGPGKERGTLTVSDIVVPLKQHYVNKLATNEINGHQLVCLLKYNEHVLGTKTVPTLPGLKSVRFPDVLHLSEVYSDFKITLEIYGMTAQRECLPHDIKYHITPGKKKHHKRGGESSLIMPPVQSPGGPNAVRTPALCQYGYIIFSIREIKQKSWVINEVASGVSPLNGNVFLKIDSQITVDVSHSGFLTMFDDINGFGAWHRRWCRLSGHTIYYWKYPEDERRKDPIGQLELTNCITEKVNLAPRHVCARLHTVLLEFKRPRLDTDEESLVLVPRDNYTIVRQLLAADTKEEREEWCQHLNKALSLMKSWGTQV